MSLEIILGALVVVAVAAFSIVLTFAKSESVEKKATVVPVSPIILKEEFVKETPIQHVAPINFAQEQVIEEKYQRIENILKEEVETLTSSNDGLRFDNQALKKELMEMTDKYRDLLVKFDQLKGQHEAGEARSIKETAIAHEQLLQEVEDLRRTQEKLKELNATITTKADLLQYELIKARAQATGYERISQNYQQQIEQLMNPKAKSNRLEAHTIES